MSIKELTLIIIVIVNSFAALCYFIWGILILPHTKKKNVNYSRSKYVITFIIMIICPLAGIMFFLTGYIMFRVFFHEDADLSDIIFSKERKAATERDDLERKMNIAPLEEAIAVSDKVNLRNLMMNIIKGDVQKSLATISLALNSEDSETSHYAASVMRDELNDFCENVQKVYIQIKKEDNNQTEYCCLLLDYMDSVLSQKVFIPMEQEKYVHLMAEVGDILYDMDRGRMSCGIMEAICLRLLEIKDYVMTEEWCNKIFDAYPKELASYTCRLKLHFNMQEKEKFFQTLEELKTSNIVIDNETLELIRVFR